VSVWWEKLTALDPDLEAGVALDERDRFVPVHAILFQVHVSTVIVAMYGYWTVDTGLGLGLGLGLFRRGGGGGGGGGRGLMGLLTVCELIVPSFQVAGVHVGGDVRVCHSLGHAEAVAELVQPTAQQGGVDR